MSEYELHALEYERLKEEQVRRIGFRDNLIYVAVTAMAAIFGFAIQDKDRVHLLLAVCPASVVLGWTYLANDQKITAIGAYVHASLRADLAAAAGVPEDRVLKWEAGFGDTRRRRRKAIQLAIDLITFCIPPVAALISYLLIVDATGWAVAAICLEALLTVALGWEIARASDLD